MTSPKKLTVLSIITLTVTNKSLSSSEKQLAGENNSTIFNLKDSHEAHIKGDEKK